MLKEKESYIAKEGLLKFVLPWANEMSKEGYQIIQMTQDGVSYTILMELKKD